MQSVFVHVLQRLLSQIKENLFSGPAKPHRDISAKQPADHPARVRLRRNEEHHKHLPGVQQVVKD